MLDNNVWSRLRNAGVAGFAIIATTIFLVTAAGSNAAVFSFVESVSKFSGLQQTRTIVLPLQQQLNGVTRSDGLTGLSSPHPNLTADVRKNERSNEADIVGYHNVNISTAGSINGSWSGGSPDVWIPTATGSNVAVADIHSRLNAGRSVVITTAGGGSESGDILLVDGVSWGTNAVLALSAIRNIDINCNITATGNSAGLTLTPGNTGDGGSYSLNRGAVITLSGNTPSLTIGG